MMIKWPAIRKQSKSKEEASTEIQQNQTMINFLQQLIGPLIEERNVIYESLTYYSELFSKQRLLII